MIIENLNFMKWITKRDIGEIFVVTLASANGVQLPHGKAGWKFWKIVFAMDLFFSFSNILKKIFDPSRKIAEMSKVQHIHQTLCSGREFWLIIYNWWTYFSVSDFIMITEGFKTTTTLKNLMTKADVKNVENSVIYASEKLRNLHIIIIITKTMIKWNLSCK